MHLGDWAMIRYGELGMATRATPVAMASSYAINIHMHTSRCLHMESAELPDGAFQRRPPDGREEVPSRTGCPLRVCRRRPWERPYPPSNKAVWQPVPHLLV